MSGNLADLLIETLQRMLEASIRSFGPNAEGVKILRQTIEAKRQRERGSTS